MVAATKSKPTAKPATTGAIIDKLWAAREEKRRLEQEVKEIGSKIEDIETDLMERLGKEGLEKATGSKASVSISSVVTADVQDWDAFYPYIAKNKFWHLLQRRPSDPGVRELWDAGKKVPGVVPFTKKKLNLRSLS